MNSDFLAQLNDLGNVFCTFGDQDSGCLSFGVAVGGKKYFIKYSDEPRGIASLERALKLGRDFSHRGLAKFHKVLPTKEGLALEYDWLNGEVLYDYTRFTSEERKNHPDCAHVRFRTLPLSQRLQSLDLIFSLHLELSRMGYRNG